MIFVYLLVLWIAFVLWGLRKRRPARRVKPDASHLRREQRRRQLLAESVARRRLSPD